MTGKVVSMPDAGRLGALKAAHQNALGACDSLSNIVDAADLFGMYDLAGHIEEVLDEFNSAIKTLYHIGLAEVCDDEPEKDKSSKDSEGQSHSDNLPTLEEVDWR